jgi:hypothetical protein
MTKALRGPTGNEFEDLCSVVGLMTLTWAYAENGLAIMLHDIIANFGPVKGHSEPPLSLKRRIACFKTALRDVAAFQPLQQDGRALAMRFGELGRRRNEFVHAAAISVDEGGFQSLSVRPDGGNYAIENKRVEVGDAVLLQAEIAEFALSVTDFMARFSAALPD